MSGDPVAEAIELHVRAALPDYPYLGLYEYRVIKQIGARIEVQAADDTAGAPDLGVIELGPGLPGGSSVLPGGSLVLVGFVNRSDRRPRVLSYAPPGEGYRPISLSIDANTLIELARTSGAIVRVGTESAQAVALGPPTASAFGVIQGIMALLAVYIAAATAHALTPVLGVTDAALTTATSALETALGLLPGQLATLTGAAPAGLVSLKLRAE